MTDERPPIRWTDERVDTPQRQQMRRLAAALHRVNEHLHELDASPDDLADIAERAELFAAAVEKLGPRRVPPVPGADRDPEQLYFADLSPLSGDCSPLAPPMHLTIDGEQVVGGVRFGASCEGPPGHVHGGWVAAGFDEVMGMVQAAFCDPGMTATLDVKYRRPTPLHHDLTFVGRIERTVGRKIFTTATLHDSQGNLLAEAAGLFVSVDFDTFRERLAND